MADKPDEKGFCPNCMATDVSFKVVEKFSDVSPEVTMSYDNWMFLRFVIEEEILRGLGVPRPEDEPEEHKTVQ